MTHRARNTQASQVNYVSRSGIGSSLLRRLFSASMLVTIVAAAADAPWATAELHQASQLNTFVTTRFESLNVVSNACWFCIMCGIAVSVLLWQLCRVRLRMNSLMSQSHAAGILEERERIARELHDTLMQSVHALMLTIQTSTARLPKTHLLRQEIDSALDCAADFLDEARDRIGGLRTPLFSLDIVRAITESANMFLLSSHVKYRLLVAGTPRTLQQVGADHIYAITREVIANAFIHADAKTIVVTIEYRTVGIRVHVQDDGRGIGPVAEIHASSARHFGLRGMRERAAQLDALLTIRSREGAGTEITLEVPASTIYTPEDAIKRRPQLLRDSLGFALKLSRTVISSVNNTVPRFPKRSGTTQIVRSY